MSDNNDIYIVIYSLIIIFIFVGIYVLYFMLSKKYSTNNTNEPVFIQCEENQCATNIFTGEKTCPEIGETIRAEAPFEVCNGRYLCNNNITPYALQTNGSTRRDGICQEGIECSCLRQPLCANYIETVFYPLTNDNSLPLNEQQITYNQRARDGSSERMKPNENEYCQIPVEWLNRSSPGCNFADMMNFNNTVQCMGLEGDEKSFPFACNTLPENYNRNLEIPITSPCLRGKIAVIGDDNINRSNIMKYPFACISTDVDCKCGEIRAVIDGINTSEIVCLSY